MNFVLNISSCKTFRHDYDVKLCMADKCNRITVSTTADGSAVNVYATCKQQQQEIRQQ